MYRRPFLRGIVGILLYVAMVTVGTRAFEAWRQSDPFGSPPPYVYVLCGPALALFTHDALFLMPIVTLILCPLWLRGINAFPTRRGGLHLLAFAVCWLAIGRFLWRVF